MFHEVKRHLNKPDEIYACTLMWRDAHRVVLRYVSDRDWAVADTLLPKGSVTDALYVDGEGFVLWRMRSPSGPVMGHLFHICTDLQVTVAQVSYLDLLLDIWVDPAGNVAILDRDEVDACRDLGKLNAAHSRAILRQEQRILAHWPELIGQLQSLLPAG